MRNVVFFQFISLDGVAEEPGDWFIEDGPELFENIVSVIQTQDDVLLGRRTYDYWVGHWPTSDFEPFAPFINATRKHVATSTDLAEPWANSVRMTSPPADYVRDLKQTEGGDIGIHGSTSLARSLIAERLVDDLRLVITSTIVGRGYQLFPEGSAIESQQFDLLDVSTSAKGTLFLHYRADPDRTGDPASDSH